MVTLIIGGSGSGKSAYAEQRLLDVKEVSDKYYIATMLAYGEEGVARVERHRRLRAGKGFITIEQPTNLLFALQACSTQTKAAMLECVSNLVANEMFGKILRTDEKLVDDLYEQFVEVSKHFSNFIIVTNNVFEDGMAYDDKTEKYQQLLGLLNQRLAQYADEVIEVVVGIPVIIKEKRLEIE